MMDLAATQAAFQNFILESDPGIKVALRRTARAPIDDMLNIYHSAYGSRLTQCLANDFPGLGALLGKDKFTALAADYIAKHPSRTPSVRWFGRHLPDYVAKTLRDPAAADMARFDWALAQAFDAPDDPVATATDLASTPPEEWAGLSLEFSRSISTVAMTTTVPEIRQRLLIGEHPTATPINAPVIWLVWRRDLEIQFRAVERDEAQAVDLVAKGGTFGQICEMLSEERTASEAPLRAAQILRGWLDYGLISHIRFMNRSTT